MTDRPDREADVFNAARQLPAARRAIYLDEACAGDAALRQHVEELLQASEEAGAFLENPSAVPARPAEAVGLPAIPAEKPGDRIGRYKLLQQIGEGGCGVVYMAGQEEPVRRQVALKVIKLGMDTKSVIARFEAERQALALMDHPSIAKVLDAGATDTGRPYFVMELVRGVKITDYCDQNNLSTGERLDLFMQICRAIQHAHQKGIIHRDIKPSNILVTLNDGVPLPKVIDFGIAKATQGKLTDQTLFTAFEQFIGTPAYMSPEQAEMRALDIDTRSDIYSLGVLLYELLTGQTPFDARELLEAGLDEIRRLIREQEPARPSTRLSTLDGANLSAIARHRKAEPPRLISMVRGDLDWIVMKCLEKDRTRRYDTANGLAMDLKRHLENEPVIARPPSAVYRIQKAWRRHKTASIVAALIAVVLVAATGISLRQATLAQQRLIESETISQFMTQVFQSPNPARDGRTITVAEILDVAARKLDTSLSNQPARRAKLQDTLGLTYQALGLYSEAIALQEKVRDYLLSTSGPENSETLRAMHNLAVSYLFAGRRDEALKLDEEMLALRRKLSGPEHPDTLAAMHNLAICYDEAGRRDEALKLQEQVLTLRRKVSGPNDPDTLRAMHSLANYYFEAGRRDEALKLREETLALFRKVTGPKHPDTIMAMNNLAGSYIEAGRHDEALKLGKEVLALRLKVSGPEHSDTLLAMTDLANSYSAAGRRDEALKLREQALALRRKVSGAGDPGTLDAMTVLATSYSEAGRRDEALKLREQVLALRREVSGPEDPATLGAMRNLAISYDETGRRDEAIKLGEQVLTLCRKVSGPESHDTLSLMHNLAISYDEAGRWDEALKLREELLALCRKVSGPEDPATILAMYNLVHSYCSANRGREAVALLEKAYELDSKDTLVRLKLASWQSWLGQEADYEATRRRALQQAESTDQASTAERAARVCCLQPSTDAALLDKALNLARRGVELGKSDPMLPWYQLALGIVEYRDGQYAAGEQTLAVVEQAAGGNDYLQGTTRLFRAMSLFRQDRPEEARSLFSQAEAKMPPLPKDESAPIVDGLPVSHDILIWWLAYKEARSALNQPSAAKP